MKEQFLHSTLKALSLLGLYMTYFGTQFNDIREASAMVEI